MRPRPRVDHGREKRAGQLDHRAHVEVDHRRDSIGGLLVERRGVADPRVVDQQVDLETARRAASAATSRGPVGTVARSATSADEGVLAQLAASVSSRSAPPRHEDEPFPARLQSARANATPMPLEAPVTRARVLRSNLQLAKTR